MVIKGTLCIIFMFPDHRVCMDGEVQSGNKTTLHMTVTEIQGRSP